MVQKSDDIIVAALKLAKIGFYRYLFDGTIVSIDQATFDFFELEGIFKDPQSLIGQKIESLFIYTGPKRRLRAKIREKGEVVGLEYGFKTLKGKEKWGIHNSHLFIDEETGKEAVQVCFYDITERKRSEEEKEKIIAELQATLAEVKTLRGIIPICSNCKKIRDDEGYWQQVEEYIQNRSDAAFSHGICNECAKKLYPNLDIYDD